LIAACNISVYESTQHNISEDVNIQQHCWKNLRFCMVGQYVPRYSFSTWAVRFL